MLFGRVLNSDGYRKQKDGTGWVNKLVEFCSHFYLRIHSHKKRKDSVEIWTVLLIFSLELQISRVAVQRIHQNSKKWWLLWGIARWKWLWGYFSYFLLSWLWCQRFWGNSEDCYRSKRLLQMLLVSDSLLNRQNISINSSEIGLVTYLLGHFRRSLKSCRSCTEKGAITGPWWVLSTAEVRW